MIEVIEFVFGMLLLTGMAFLAYMSSQLVSEKKAGKTIPLPWEKGGWKVFNKHDVEYRDGDNT